MKAVGIDRRKVVDNDRAVGRGGGGGLKERCG